MRQDWIAGIRNGSRRKKILHAKLPFMCDGGIECRAGTCQLPFLLADGRKHYSIRRSSATAPVNCWGGVRLWQECTALDKERLHPVGEHAGHLYKAPASIKHQRPRSRLT